MEKNASKTREHLKLAGIERRVLFDGTTKLLPFDFRSWRTTRCTWHAMNGTDSWVIARWSGHKTPETTWDRYVKQAPEACRREGTPFGPLPAELLAPVRIVRESFGGPQVGDIVVRRAGLENRTVLPASTSSYGE